MFWGRPAYVFGYFGLLLRKVYQWLYICSIKKVEVQLQDMNNYFFLWRLCSFVLQKISVQIDFNMKCYLERKIMDFILSLAILRSKITLTQALDF